MVETGLNRNKPFQRRHGTEHPENQAWILAVVSTELRGTLAADLVPERPGQRGLRAVKGKKNKHPLLAAPCHRFRDLHQRNVCRGTARLWSPRLL
jgi:hypothetical protein